MDAKRPSSLSQTAIRHHRRFRQGSQRQRHAGRLDRGKHLPALSRPFALAFDSDRAACWSPTRARASGVFAKGANGNVAPVAQITSAFYPAGVIADANDHI